MEKNLATLINSQDPNNHRLGLTLMNGIRDSDELKAEFDINLFIEHLIKNPYIDWHDNRIHWGFSGAWVSSMNTITADNRYIGKSCYYYFNSHMPMGIQSTGNYINHDDDRDWVTIKKVLKYIIRRELNVENIISIEEFINNNYETY